LDPENLGERKKQRREGGEALTGEELSLIKEDGRGSAHTGRVKEKHKGKSRSL